MGKDNERKLVDKTKKDTVSKSFWRDNEHFADLFNAVLFGGEQVVKPDNLEEMDTDVSGVIMADEFLSGIKKDDRFHPIINIILYYGEKEWDGPVSLKDMMVDMPDKLADKFNDYQINLVQIRDAGKYNFNNEDVKFLFDFVADIYNDGDFDKILTEYEGKDVSVDLIELIGKITGTKELMTISDNVRKGKVTNMEMCSAMKKFQEDAIQKGKAEGKINSIRTLMKKLNQTAEEAMDMLDIEEKDREMYRKLLEIKEQSDT